MDHCRDCGISEMQAELLQCVDEESGDEYWLCRRCAGEDEQEALHTAPAER